MQQPVDPVSGNPVPPGGNPMEVRDNVPAMLSPGEYILPADVVKVIGLEKISKMHRDAEETMAKEVPSPMSPGRTRGFNSGGLVTWDPTNFSYPGTTFFPQVNVPKKADTETGLEYRVYTNGQGSQISIPFRDGAPLEEIPEGYFLLTDYQQAEKAVWGDHDEPNDWETRDTSISPEDNYFNMTPEQLMAQLDRGEGLSSIFNFLPGLAGGLLGGLVSAGQRSHYNTILQVATELGYSEVAAAAQEKLGDASESNTSSVGGIMGSIFNNLGNGSSSEYNKHLDAYKEYGTEDRYTNYEPSAYMNNSYSRADQYTDSSSRTSNLTSGLEYMGNTQDKSTGDKVSVSAPRSDLWDNDSDDGSNDWRDSTNDKKSDTKTTTTDYDSPGWDTSPSSPSNQTSVSNKTDGKKSNDSAPNYDYDSPGPFYEGGLVKRRKVK